MVVLVLRSEWPRSHRAEYFMQDMTHVIFRDKLPRAPSICSLHYEIIIDYKLAEFSKIDSNRQREYMKNDTGVIRW